MKRDIPLVNEGNQEFSFGANGHEVFVSLFSVYDLMCAQVSIDDTLVCSGVKCISGVSILPKSSEDILNGRLYFESGDKYPNADIIGTVDCKLIFEERG